MGVVTEWWTVLRIPLVVALAFAWVFLLRRRRVGQAQPSLATSENIAPTESPSSVRAVAPPPTTSNKNESQPTIENTDPSRKETVTKLKTKRTPKKFTRTLKEDRSLPAAKEDNTPEYHVFYASQFKHTSTLAKHITTLLPQSTYLHDIALIPNLDDYFLQHCSNSFYFILVPSYANDSGPTQRLIDALEETLNDFRVDANPLATLRGFVVFGMGDREGWPLKREFCYQALRVERLMKQLGAKRVFMTGMGDTKGRISLETQLEGWLSRVLKSLERPKSTNEKPIDEKGTEDSPSLLSDDDMNDDNEPRNEEGEEGETPLLDVEDIGPINQRKSTTIFTPKPMVSRTSTTYAALTKQGYTVIGTHSGVKICRWTKSALRGRGSCYKFSFYGIKSHLCMEMTPSLACANKCVFCWRHGTNPVGTTWRWEVESAEMVYHAALEGHYAKIRMLRGMMGVKAERYEEAKRVRHCALSLVGEPIFYPHINEFLGLLHRDRISSFLVTNAQHPSALRTLRRPTQLYVSIDASNKESLKAIDRPLFKDFWERTLECLDILRERQEELRTVYRFTLVRGFNMDEIPGYGGLIDRGRPWLIEIKGAHSSVLKANLGVTYCGKSDESSLTMHNVPFYEEVVGFAKRIVEEINRRRTDTDLPEYAIAAEHAHSCCILIARTTLRREGKWFTHIDYPRFFDLLESKQPFGPADYTVETPEWAYFGNGGFNPEDVHVKRNKKADKEKEGTALVKQIDGQWGRVIEGEEADVVLDGGCGG